LGCRRLIVEPSGAKRWHAQKVQMEAVNAKWVLVHKGDFGGIAQAD
jgi:hypothetical protein